MRKVFQKNVQKEEHRIVSVLMLCPGSKSDQSNVLQQGKAITDIGIGRPWP